MLSRNRMLLPIIVKVLAHPAGVSFSPDARIRLLFGEPGLPVPRLPVSHARRAKDSGCFSETNEWCEVIIPGCHTGNENVNQSEALACQSQFSPSTFPRKCRVQLCHGSSIECKLCHGLCGFAHASPVIKHTRASIEIRVAVAQRGSLSESSDDHRLNNEFGRSLPRHGRLTEYDVPRACGQVLARSKLQRLKVLKFKGPGMLLTVEGVSCLAPRSLFSHGHSLNHQSKRCRSSRNRGACPSRKIRDGHQDS
jgi:hypothetical protein